MSGFENRLARIRAARETKGLNVHFLREDGTPDSFSFADPARAEAFRASLIRQGRTITAKAN